MKTRKKSQQEIISYQNLGENYNKKIKLHIHYYGYIIYMINAIVKKSKYINNGRKKIDRVNKIWDNNKNEKQSHKGDYALIDEISVRIGSLFIKTL